MGLPTFGHSYAGVAGLSNENHAPGKTFTSAGASGPSTKTPGLLAYYEVADMIAQNLLAFGIDPVTNTALAYNIPLQKWVSYDTPDTIALKAELAKSKGLGGVMLWTIDMDEYQWEPNFPNIRSAASIMSR